MPSIGVDKDVLLRHSREVLLHLRGTRYGDASSCLLTLAKRDLTREGYLLMRILTIVAAGVLLILAVALVRVRPSLANGNRLTTIAVPASVATSLPAQHAFVELILLGERLEAGSIYSNTPFDVSREPLSDADLRKTVARVQDAAGSPVAVRSRFVTVLVHGIPFRTGQVLVGVEPLSTQRLRALLDSLETAAGGTQLYIMRLVSSRDSCRERDNLRQEAANDADKRAKALAAMMQVRLTRRSLFTGHVTTSARDVSSFCGNQTAWPDVPTDKPTETAFWGDALPRYYSLFEGTLAYEAAGVPTVSNPTLRTVGEFSISYSDLTKSADEPRGSRLAMTVKSTMEIQPSWVLVRIVADRGYSMSTATEALERIRVPTADIVVGDRTILVRASSSDGSLGNVMQALRTIPGVHFQEISVVDQCEPVNSFIDARTLHDALSHAVTVRNGQRQTLGRVAEVEELAAPDGPICGARTDTLSSVGARIDAYLERHPEYAEYPFTGVPAEFSRRFMLTLSDGSRQ